MRKKLLQIAEKLMVLPTAPFREDAVRAFIRDFCQTRGMDVMQDHMGNLRVLAGGRVSGPALAFSAHMDHPGFIVEQDSYRNCTSAIFYGGVEDEYFAGARVRMFTAAEEVCGRVVGKPMDLPRKGRRVRLALDGPVRRGDLGMWDLIPFQVRGDKLTARACDDLGGCVALLTFLDELVQRKCKVRILALFTAAEEAGLHGAIRLSINKQIPVGTPVVSIETSRELPTARRGDGVVIRVGDSGSVFHHGLLRYMVHAARTVARRDRNFHFQRRLMDGGTCESTIYQAFGHVTAGVCVPLGNYHNRNFKRRRIAAECVSVTDLDCMVKLFLGMVEELPAMKTFLKPARPRYCEERWKLGERMMWQV